MIATSADLAIADHACFAGAFPLRVGRLIDRAGADPGDDVVFPRRRRRRSIAAPATGPGEGERADGSGTMRD